MRTADRAGVPLSVIHRGRKPGRRWLPTDRTLATALTRHQDGLCSGCGQPVDTAWGETARAHTVAHTTCAACAALESDRDEHKDPKPGTKTYVVAGADEGVTRFGPTFG